MVAQSGYAKMFIYHDIKIFGNIYGLFAAIQVAAGLEHFLGTRVHCKVEVCIPLYYQKY
jgi:hypothetical protein